MLRYLILYPKSIFKFIPPVHVHLKMDKVDLKKSHCDFFFIFFQPTHQVGMKKVVKYYKDIFGYFNQWCPYYRFDDNNNINHKDIASTLGDFGIHFIGIKTLKEHFYKKMVNLTSYTLEF